ncbi:hypothetical protein [Streptomyces sp. NPDC059631]|uniref:hypothetical protein n=1 Tax=unclassified Streptomyces TaxID=2593676 RepID=UPI003683F9FD
MSAMIVAGIAVIGGCGSDSQKTEEPGSHAVVGGQHSQTPPAESKATVTERANGSWKSVVKGSDVQTLIIKDGHVSARGQKLACEGALKPGTKNGNDVPTLAFTSCRGRSDGGRGLGHLTMKGTDALAINWEGLKGGWGGPVDSFHRNG